MDKLQPPGTLSFAGNVAENWRKWKQRFQVYLTASGIDAKDQKVQSATLLHVAGEEALEIYNTFTWDNDGDDEKVSAIMAKFEAHCNPRKNITWERHLFNTRNQQPGETIDQYVTDLRTKAKTCEFGTLSDSLIRDRIVGGIISDSTRSRLLQKADLTLEKAIDMCRASETTAAQMKTLTAGQEASGTLDTADVNTVGMDRQKSTGDKRKYQCGRCGTGHTRQQPCPAMGAECLKCGRRNHFARVCRTKAQRKQRPKVHGIGQDSSDEDESGMFVAVIEKDMDTKDWKATVKLNGQPTTLKLDTGAQCNVISKRSYDLISRRPLLKSKTKLVTFGGHKMKACGKACITCEYKDKYTIVEFEVVKQDVPNVLGLKTCKEMNLVQRIDSIGTAPSDMLDEYKDVFEGLGCITNATHHIKIDKHSKPVVHPPRRVPVTLRSKLKDELNRMEQLNVIERVHEPTNWVNSMVIVTKPNGKLWICIDPRDLNKAIKREHYPMRTIEEVVTRMPNAQVFSVLDANSGFWQVQLDHESSKLCTFNTPFGRYRFKRLPFGISSAQDVFQSTMSEMFEDIEGVEVVVDDLLIWGETETEHDERLRKVLERTRQCNLKLNKEKSQIKLSEIHYIGHILNKEGLKPDPEKVKAICTMKSPESKEELQRFLGMVTYLGKFIPNLSQAAAPLRTLLESNVEWHWTEHQEASFTALKKLVTEAPVLKFFDPTKPVKISVDASSKGMGAVLLQDEQPIAYASKALTKSQQNYAQIEKEMLAIVFTCTRFHEYIFGLCSIEVETDHKPLEMILTKPLHQAPTRLQKMIMTIQKYPITVKYRPGKELIIADTLSRAYLPEEASDICAEEFEVNIVYTLPISESKLETFKDETAKDPSLQELKTTVEKGWPESKSRVSHRISPYWNYRDEISTYDGIMFKGEKVIVPKTMQREMLEIIHSSHLGMEKCKCRARDVLYWPGMNSEIENTVSRCQICSTYRRSNSREPLLSHPAPERPWARVGADLFELNSHNFLVLVDYYSGYIEVEQLRDTKSEVIIKLCKSQFARYGIPDTLVTDNGPQFSSEAFRDFAHHYGFRHCTVQVVHITRNQMAEQKRPCKPSRAYSRKPVTMEGIYTSLF